MYIWIGLSYNKGFIISDACQIIFSLWVVVMLPHVPSTLEHNGLNKL